VFISFIHLICPKCFKSSCKYDFYKLINNIVIVGSIEYLIAKPYSEFSWPLEVNLTRVISDYETGHYHVAPINEQKFLLKVQPTADKCQG